MKHRGGIAFFLGIALFAVMTGGVPAGAAPSSLDHGEALRQTPLNSTADFLRALDRTFPLVLKTYGNTAAVAVVIENGKVIANYAWGTADGVPATENSVFGAASISKLVTAWGVMKLVDEGRIKLDSPAATYLTGAQKASLPFDTGVITVRQLLSHTSGLSGRSVAEVWPGQKVGTVLQELSAKTADGSPQIRINGKPGTSWAYSGAGYGVIQLIVENVTGKPFSEFMNAEVLRRLGMTKSFFGNRELEQGAVIQHFDEAGQPIKRSGYANLAAAGLYTTATDFIKLAMADMQSAHVLLRDGDVSEMHTAAPGTGGKYGLGYFVERLTDTEKVVGHDGSDTGWNSMYRMVPGRKDAIIIFTNSSLGIGAYFPVMCGWYRSLGSDRTDYCPATPWLTASTLYSKGQGAALEMNSRLSKLDKNYAFDRAYWNYIASVMIDRKSFREALTMLKFIAALNPTSPNAFDSLGNGYKAANDRKNAITAYRHALALDPNLESSKASLRALGNF